jgi:hypothetical protein
VTTVTCRGEDFQCQVAGLTQCHSNVAVPHDDTGCPTDIMIVR